MRAVIIIVPLVFCTVSPGAESIDAQIEAIQKAPAKERFRLMNALKKRLVQMKEKERIEALSKLRSSTRSVRAKRAIEKVEKDTKRISREHLESLMESHIENEVEQIGADHEGGDDD